MRENQFKTAMVEKVEAKSQPVAEQPSQQKVIESDEEDAPLIKSKKESPRKRGRGASEAATERMQTALALEALDDDDEEEVIQKYPRKQRVRGTSETEVKSPTMKSPTMKSPTMKSPSHVQNLSTSIEEQPIAKDEAIEKSPLKKSRGRGSSETNLSPAYEPTSFKTAPSPALASSEKFIEQPPPLKIESPKKTSAQEVCPVQEPKVPAEQKTPISEKVSTEQTPKERVEVSEKSATKVMESPKKQVLATEVIAKKSSNASRK